MELRKLAQDRREVLLAEIQELEWFLAVAERLLSQDVQDHEEIPIEHAIQVGPIKKIDKDKFKRNFVDGYREKRQMAG